MIITLKVDHLLPYRVYRQEDFQSQINHKSPKDFTPSDISLSFSEVIKDELESDHSNLDNPAPVLAGEIISLFGKLADGEHMQ